VKSEGEHYVRSVRGKTSLLGFFDNKRVTGNTIELHFAVNTDLQKKTETGETFDVAALHPPAIDALIKDDKLASGAWAYIGRAGASTAH
jgi:hypothetical protein